MFAVVVLAGIAAPARAEPTATTIAVDVASDLGPVRADLVGFNWRAGGEAVGPLRPRFVRIWSADLSKITAAPGTYDWSLPDRDVDAVRSIGATPLVVIVGRPPWSPEAGSPGYQAAVAAIVERYGAQRVPAGAEPAWFESGNEPEFPPTSHGQLPHELPADTVAQARAVASVEARSGRPVRWGGPAALFADPPVVEAFAAAATIAGRPADFLSWHSYTNQPFLGPDGAEFDDPAYEPGYATLGRRNPAASPVIIGAGTDVMRAIASTHVAPGGGPPDVILSEWHLSSGGLDRRHDTHEGAAHTVAGLVELQDHEASAATFFAATDRHCPQDPAGPDPTCGDWGTATADGVRKPVWHAFAWWQRMAGTRLAVAGADPLDGLWAMASRRGTTTRVLVASFSVSDPRDRRLVLDLGQPGSHLTVSRIDPSTGASPSRPVHVPAGEPIPLPAGSVLLVEARDPAGRS